MVEAIDEPRLHGEVSDYQDISIKEWLKGAAPVWPRPWMALVRMPSRDWLLAAGPKVDDERISRFGKSRRLQTIVAGYDSAKARSYFRSYDGGKVQVDYHAQGEPREPLGKARLKSTIPVEEFLANATTPETAITSLLEHFQVSDMRLAISQTNSNLRLHALDNRELTSKAVREVCVLEHWPLISGDNKATDELWAALREGDPIRTRQAIEAGANLNYLPATSISPIGLLVLNRKGNWQKCIRALVGAGAPLNGIPGQEPTIYRCVWQVIRYIGDEPSPIPAIDLLLELGADINARCLLKHHHRWTPLHRAVENCNPLLVRHLVSRGADSTLVDDKGRTALAIALENAKHLHGEARPASEKIASILSHS